MSSATNPPISSIPSHPHSSAVTTSSSITRDPIVLLTLPISTKLTRNNFLAWKSQIVPLLHVYRLHKYLDSAPPAEKIELAGKLQDNPAFDHWIQQDQLILGWLRSSLSETILGEVVSCTSSSDLWRALQQSFSASSRSRLLELRRSLQTRTKGGLSCSDYFSQMRATAHELAFIGSPVPEEDLVLYILGGLGADFNSFVTTITARQGGTSLPELQSLLLTHEKMLSNQVSSVLSSSSSSSNPLLTTPRFLFLRSKLTVSLSPSACGEANNIAQIASAPSQPQQTNQRLELVDDNRSIKDDQLD